MHPKSISILDFSYDLPSEKIAKYPLENRDESKLLHFKNGEISDHVFAELPNLLSKNTHLVFNNTKVVHARLNFNKETGAKIELFCLEPKDGNYPLAFGKGGVSEWKCMLGNAKRWKSGVLVQPVEVNGLTFELCATLLSLEGQFAYIRFTWNQDAIFFGDILSASGKLPIPPYLNREAEKKDETQYQTTYAKTDGSVAAPTAGLHFTQRTFDALQQNAIGGTELTLHVGAGTFLPVKAAQMADHEMHREHIEMDLDALIALHEALVQKKDIIPVGTTSLRSLETLYWYGVKIILDCEDAYHFKLNQWEPYELKQDISCEDAFLALIKYLEKQPHKVLFGSTQLLIAPGYKLRTPKAIITNFHQPQSTLLLLVAALIGDNWKAVYQHALDNNYRFLSFGDSSILYVNEPTPNAS
jgi:S-adenosylmethionine:tRNA ribosyltransferase-isomerase